MEWVRAWAPHAGERHVPRALHRYPWMVEVVRQRPVSTLHPYTVEVYAARDGSEACLSLAASKAYCARDGAASETKPELAFSRYEVYEEKIRVYRPKGLQAYTTTAKEHVKLFYFTCIKKPPCGLASFRGLGLLARLAKVAGMTVYSIRNAANKMGI